MSGNTTWFKRSDLEVDVFRECVIESGENPSFTVVDILYRLNKVRMAEKRKVLAYTTIKTVLDRLVEKQFLFRQKDITHRNRKVYHVLENAPEEYLKIIYTRGIALCGSYEALLENLQKEHKRHAIIRDTATSS